MDKKDERFPLKGLNSSRKSGGGVLLNILSVPAYNVNSISTMHSTYSAMLAKKPDGPVQIWFQIVPSAIQSPAGNSIRKYPSSDSGGTYKAIPIEATYDQLVKGLSITDWSQIFDIREPLEYKDPSTPFEQLRQLSFNTAKLKLTITVNENTNVIGLTGGSDNLFAVSAGSYYSAVLTMITEKV